MGGERLDISEEMATPPPLQNLSLCFHYGRHVGLVNRVLKHRCIHPESGSKTGVFVIFRELI
jgi:hypothetical protein